MTQYKKFKIGASYVVRGHLIDNDPNGLFVIMPTKRRINAKDAKAKGPFNYVSRGTTNNGIASKIQYDSKYLNDGHTLSFAQDTAAIFYQDEPYFTGNKVNVFKLNDKYGNLTHDLALYLVGAIRSAFPDFKWGMMLNIEKIANTDIELPVTPVGEPDFEYMTMRIRELEAERIRELEAERIRELEAYLRVTGLDDTTLSASEAQALTQDVKWKKFKIGDMFDIRKGRRLTKANQLPGNTPFIGSSATDHGVTGYIGQDPIFEGRTLTVSYNGSVGQVFYQTDSYWASDDINVLSLKNKDVELTPEIGNYLATCLTMAGKGFGYNRKWNVARMAKTDIELPVTADGDIDFDFDYMQTYIRALEKQTIKGVVEYKDKVIQETKKVVNG